MDTPGRVSQGGFRAGNQRGIGLNRTKRAKWRPGADARSIWTTALTRAAMHRAYL